MEQEEVWIDIIDYEGLYQISSLGRIKSLPKKKGLGNGWITKEQMKNFNTDKDGYYRVGLSKKSKKKSYRVNRLVAIHFIPNPENKEQVNHKKGNRKDNRASELEWNTCSENILHSFRVLKKAHPRGALGKTWKRKSQSK